LPVVGHGTSKLTPRERDVLRLMCGGVTSYAGLTEALCVSRNTVHYHLDQLLMKLQVNDRAQIVAYAWAHQLVARNEVIWRGTTLP
jgi:DNA-binding CsgD family transcriptional regulator